MIGDGWPGAHRVDVAAQPGDERVALGASGRSAARPAPAAASPGVDAVVKMNGRAALTSRSTTAWLAGHEAAQRAERLRQRADAHDVDVAPGVAARSRCGPSTAWASSSTSSAPWRRHTAASSSTGRDVAVHREHGVGDDDRGTVVGGEQLVDVVDVVVAGDRDLALGRAGSRR